MKTRIPTEQFLLELAGINAANEDGMNPPATREAVPAVGELASTSKVVWLARGLRRVDLTL